MRNDLTPQVETSEIDDADLDQVAGGGPGLVAGVEALLHRELDADLLHGHHHRHHGHHHGHHGHHGI